MKLDVQSYVEKQKDKLKKDFRSIENPKLMIFSSDVNGATKSYLKNKIKVGEELGVEVIVKNVDNVNSLYKELRYCRENSIPTILQLPVDNKLLVTAYNSAKDTDIDGFFRYGEIYKSYTTENILPATPRGIVSYIKHWCDEKSEDLAKLSVCILGRGELVGKPLATMILPHVGTLSIITSKTNRLDVFRIVKMSDIIVLATGDDNLGYLEHCISTKNKLVIDTGIFVKEDGKLRGEAYPFIDELEKFNVDYTPVPKGVGILTTLNLFENVFIWYAENDKVNWDMIKEK